MNKTHFEWRLIKKYGEPNYRHCLVEVNESGNLRFWGTLEKVENMYNPFVFNKTRNGLMSINKLFPLEDAKIQIEKKLFDDGVMHDWDVLIDYTE